MDEILKIDTIDRYNKLFGFETRHPLVDGSVLSCESVLRPDRLIQH